MKLTELAELVVMKSGQHIVGDLSDLGFKLDTFWKLAQAPLDDFNNHRPVESKIRVSLNQLTMSPAPQHVSAVIPTLVPALGNLDNVHDPVEVVPFEYDETTGRLAIGHTVGPWMVTGHYARVPVEERNGSGVLIEVEIPNVDYGDDEFIDMVTGLFMMSLGRSRRAFTLEEFPLTTDAAEMIQEGKEMMDEAEASLKDKNDWSAGFQI